MATANFETMKYDMPLIVGGFYDENDPDCERQSYEEVECIKEDLADFNDTLKHFEVGIESGYYDGFQFTVKQTDEYWDYDDLPTMTDDDADYYYGDTAENIRKEFEQDLKNIKEYLYNLKANGFMELAKVAQFSNGEAMYKEVA